MINELVLIGIWKKNSISERLWKYFEKVTINRSNKVLFISNTMKKDFLNRSGLDDNKDRYIVYYNKVDFNHFEPINKAHKQFTFLYSGSLGHWNNLYTYLSFFKRICNIHNDSVLYIVTSTRPSKYTGVLNSSEFMDIRNKIKLFTNVNYEDLPGIYSECNYGLQLMNKSDSRLGVKFVEYIATGLIPIVNENVKGAVEFIKIYSTGLVIKNDFDEIDEAFIDSLLDIRASFPDNISYIRQLIDANSSASELSKIFK
ncbi:MAG: glycosyltransferase [candidate division KSB1 bacterium]|nr:glycosyltransferase [candidate division KSB1 bacterium]